MWAGGASRAGEVVVVMDSSETPGAEFSDPGLPGQHGRVWEGDVLLGWPWSRLAHT